MKNLLLGVGLVACIVACKSETKAVSDPTPANMPKAECSTKEGACADKAMKAECSSEKKAACCPSQKPQG